MTRKEGKGRKKAERTGGQGGSWRRGEERRGEKREREVDTLNF